MSYRAVEIQIGRKQVEWFVKRNHFPVVVQINERTAIFGEKAYSLHPQPDGWTAISRLSGTIRMVIGEFNKDTIRKVVSKNAARECRVIRSAALNVPYNCPRGYRVARYTVIHPGECWRTWKQQNPSGTFRAINSISEHNNDDLCIVCEEGFQ